MAKTKNTTQQIRAADYTGELKVPVYPRMTDNQGRIKAEHVLKLMDIAGGLPGFKLLAPGALIVTGTFDRTNFKNQIWAWEIIEIQSRLTQLWSHSFEVQVCVRANDFRKAKTREVATAYLVYVVLDENRQARDIPYALDLTDPNTQQLAMAADLRKANRKKETREIPFIPITEEDQPVIVEEVMAQNDANAHDNVFGGVILKLLGHAGREAALRQALGASVLGVRMDRMRFEQPAFIGETIRAKAIVTKTWNTSQEVQVEAEAVNPHTGDIRTIARCYMVFVRLAQNTQINGSTTQKAQVPPWNPKTDLQQQRADDAEQRRTLRRQEEETIQTAEA